MSQPNGSSRLDRIEQALESHDKILTRIENQQVEIQASMRDLQGIVGNLQTSLRDLESIVGNLAKTVDELVRAITAAGRTNGGKP